MNKYTKEASNFFNHLNNEEFKQLAIRIGLEVEEQGQGKLIFTQE